ncbi:MAG TPA: histidine kinase dimerization/phosphoacceptor domain -containing protein [Bacteroidia bacterium]
MSVLTSSNISPDHIIDQFSEGIMVLDASYKIIFASNSFLSLSGFESSDIITKSIDSIFTEKADGLRFILDSDIRKSADKLYTAIRSKNNQIIPVRISVAKDAGKDGQQQYFVFVKDGRSYQRVRKDILRKAVAIEHLSRSRKIRDGKLNAAIYEVLQMASRALNTERVNAWLFNADHSEIECIGNFDAIENKMVEQENLARITIPKYFELFETEMIITTSDAINDPVAKELLEAYLNPNRIRSLMDIPIRVEGEIIGVVCFEHRDTIRVWNLQEQKFGLVIAQMISLALETSAKLKARNDLEAAVQEQKVLLKEVNHRAKNNLAIISSLLNLQANKAKDDYHKHLFLESRTRMDSIAAVHELLYQSKSFSSINFQHYLDDILVNLDASFPVANKKINIIKKMEGVELDVSVAIPLALIANEVITNSYKYAFDKVEAGVLEVSLTEKDQLVLLTIKDNGPGYDASKATQTSLGLEIIQGLVQQIDGRINYSYDGGAVHEIGFTKS